MMTTLPRRHPSGLPYRPGVGVILLNPQARVFVGQRLDTSLEAWQMPQGGIDPNEDPATAALRELEEETGVPPRLARITRETPDWHYYDLPANMVGTIWKGRYCGQKQKWFTLDFLGEDTDINIATPHPEFRTWRWAHPEELVDLAVPFKRDLYTDILKSLLPEIFR